MFWRLGPTRALVFYHFVLRETHVVDDAAGNTTASIREGCRLPEFASDAPMTGLKGIYLIKVPMRKQRIPPEYCPTSRISGHCGDNVERRRIPARSSQSSRRTTLHSQEVNYRLTEGPAPLRQVVGGGLFTFYRVNRLNFNRDSRLYTDASTQVSYAMLQIPIGRTPDAQCKLAVTPPKSQGHHSVNCHVN